MKKLNMNAREEKQIKIFKKFEQKLINQTEASQILEISTRWFRKKYKSFMQKPEQGIAHRNRGKVSPSRIDENIKALILTQLQGLWHDFGPTLIAEQLELDFNIKISKESVRKLLIDKGMRKSKKQRITYRTRRERRIKFGMLVQLDGSPHDWFEDRGERCTLLVFIDDATSKILWLEFSKTESMKGVMKATKNYMIKYGTPDFFYNDRGSVFCINTGKDKKRKKTPWQRSVTSLGVEIIHARSPQAKGRVERCNQTMQDRLIKKMRLAQISSMEEGNAFLQHSGFIELHNEKYSVKSAVEGDAHRSVVGCDLNEIFSISEYRILGQDFSINYKKSIFQLHQEQTTLVQPKDKIEIRTNLNDNIKLYLNNVSLNFDQVTKNDDFQLPFWRVG